MIFRDMIDMISDSWRIRRIEMKPLPAAIPRATKDAHSSYIPKVSTRDFGPNDKEQATRWIGG